MDLDRGWLLRLGDEGALLALLALGHVAADFVAQTDEMVRRKTPAPGMLLHGGLVALVQLGLVLPYAEAASLPVLLALAAAHVLVDAGKVWLRPRTRLKATVFLGDQAAHLALVFLAWCALVAWGLWTPRAVGVEPAVLATTALLAAAYAFAWNGGGAIVRELLLGRGGDQVETPNGMGKLIGCLERWLVITLVLLSQWAAIAFVFTAKSIARFKQMEDRPFAEYYLVGTLASLATAAAIGLAAGWMLGF